MTAGMVVPISELYAPVQDQLLAAQQVFDDELVSDLDFINVLCDTVRSYRGKLLRPALLLLSGKAAGGMSPSHVTLAAVVEIVHMATLVHDDVLDEADERRRRPTIRALTGNTTAVLLGDYLISHAFHLCSSLPDPYACRRIGATTNAVCEGELLQNRYCGHASLNESLYFDIVRKKTAALTAAACELGAHYAGAEANIVQAMHCFGERAGIAFQIIDDCLDITGNARSVGKSLERDLPSGKLTLPTIHCLGRCGHAAREGLVSMLTGENPYDRAAVNDWLRQSGSIEYAFGVAEEYVEEARRRLDILAPSDARTSLTAMAEFITRRTF